MEHKLVYVDGDNYRAIYLDGKLVNSGSYEFVGDMPNVELILLACGLDFESERREGFYETFPTNLDDLVELPD